jgi:CRP-like cAMP-binding protein
VVKIRLPAEGSNGHYLATLQRGDFFGEMSFLDKETRSADAVVETETCLYVLSQRAFNGLRRANPSVSGLLFARLAAELSRRLRQNHVELKALAED